MDPYSDYMDVGIRELKAKLSEYVAKSAAGQQITITDRGRPVAELSPIGHTSALERGIDEGWVEPPRRSGLCEPLLFKSELSTSAILTEDRGD